MVEGQGQIFRSDSYRTIFFLLDLAHRSYFFRINTVLLAREDERYLFYEEGL